ncbi:MAG: septum formation initiator family protein [Alistipes sp.]|nr:septum formation initiator family protein [Alistipes sp.]MCD8172444.1 septum formation initiator family protein [Alistipes sp.]
MANKILKDRRIWILTMVVFVLLLVFFDRNNVIDRIKLRRQIRQLEAQRDYYLDRIREDSLIIERLKDDDFLEKYAREHYLMKQDGDEVFIITK